MCDRDKGRHLRLLQKWGGAKYSMTREVIDEFLHDLESGVAETADMLQIKLPDTNHEDIIRDAREHLLAISLGQAQDLRVTQESEKSLQAANVELEHKATTDKLSGLPNRAALDDKIKTEVHSRLNRKKPLLLAVIMIDIDHFKAFNDTKGHAAGDVVIKGVGKAITEALRPEDFGARYGGEEFTVVMPLTTREGVSAVAERVRSRIEALECVHEGETLKVTISLGCATLEKAQSQLDGERLVEQADKKLYEAKQAGRNQVCF